MLNVQKNKAYTSIALAFIVIGQKKSNINTKTFLKTVNAKEKTLCPENHMHAKKYQKRPYRKNSKIWDTSNNCHNCPKNRNV